MFTAVFTSVCTQYTVSQQKCDSQKEREGLLYLLVNSSTNKFMIVCLRRRKCPLHSCADYILHFHNSKNETWGVLNVFILCWYKRNVKIWLEMFFKCNLDCKQRKYTGKHCIVILRMTQLLWACSVLLSFVLISTTSLWGSQSPPLTPRVLSLGVWGIQWNSKVFLFLSLLFFPPSVYLAFLSLTSNCETVSSKTNVLMGKLSLCLYIVR